MKKNILFCFVLCLLLITSVSIAADRADNVRAFSLKEFQNFIKQPPEDETAELLALFCGVTDIQGFVIDNEAGDIIIFGRVDSALPFIYTDDFITALRNAWMKYARFEGDTYYYANPGCSIDPDPAVLSALNSKLNEIMSNESVTVIDSLIGQWQPICEQPQNVRVLGIPFDTHFARVMVDADYLLKRIVDSSVELDIPGLIGLAALRKQAIAQDVENNKPISIAMTSMNRFWFSPGENVFVINKDIVSIDECPVELLTEAQYLHAASASLVGTGGTDPLAAKFTSAFSAHYDEIADKEPIYKELSALFRLVALAKTLKHYQADEIVNMDYFLDDRHVDQIPVERSMPGRSNIDRFEHSRESQESLETIVLWLPSCGGVGIDIEVEDKNLVRDIDNKLTKIRDKVIQSRPKENSLFWDVK